MSNITAYKRYLSLLLVFVLFVPAGIKITHHVFVKHEQCHLHGHEDGHGGTVIDKVHKVCPICTFHFVEFFSDANTQPTGTPFALSDDCPAFIQQEIPAELLYQFHLRGPPLHS